MSDIKQSVERAALLAHCQCRPDRAVERLRAQRDDLLAALEGVVAVNDKVWGSAPGTARHAAAIGIGPAVDAACAAIANARGAK